MPLSRQDGLALLYEHTETDSLRKHALAVEAAMRAYARRLGEDEELWGLTGLLHDFDYEKHPSPEEHPVWGSRILRERGCPQEMIHAILAHADYLSDQYPRRSRLDRTLYAVDELCGFITACALVRPHRLEGLTSSSVRKKLKQKSFAAKVNREDIYRGAEELAVELNEHIAFCIGALQEAAAELGLEAQEG